MKFIINKNDIKSILAKVQGITGRRTNLAITETVLIEALEAGIKITATDLETGFEGEYPASVESQGIIAINAKKLYEIVRDFPIGDIHINEVENRWIQIGNHNIEYHIVGMNPQDYPDTSKIDSIPFFEMDSALLRRMIEKTVIIAGANDDKRAHINGVYLDYLEHEDNKVIKMVSTDGSRLSLVDYIYEGTAVPFESGVLIPKKGLYEVSKFLDTQGSVQVGLKENQLIIKKDTELLTVRLLEGDFPKYGDIIVKNEGYNIIVDRQLFLMMLKRMAILYSDDYKGVVFNFSENKLQITATNPDIGESKEDMEIEYSGESIEIAFNPKYFIEALNVIDDEFVDINIIDGARPCLIKGDKDKSYLSVIMPMRL